MKDLHPKFIPRWTKLTLEALKKGKKGMVKVHAFVLMKDKTLEYTNMDTCYVGESRCFDWYGSNEHYCSDCDGVWAYPPKWIYNNVKGFLHWKEMFYSHMQVNHYKLLKRA